MGEVLQAMRRQCVNNNNGKFKREYYKRAVCKIYS